MAGAGLSRLGPEVKRNHWVQLHGLQHHIGPSSHGTALHGSSGV